MSRRAIQSPGIEIREIDLTTRAAEDVGTNIFVAGFANQGPTDEILVLDTFASFEDIYGKPTNAAERYFYHSVKNVFNSDATVYASRLPYGANTGTSEVYTALVYPVVSPNTISVSSITISGTNANLHTNSGPATDQIGITVYLNLEMKDSNGSIISVNEKLENVDFDSNNILYGTAINTVVSGVSAYTIVDSHIYTTSVAAASGFSTSLSASDYYIVGNPTLVTLTQAQYEQVKRGEITWSDNAQVGKNADFTFTNIGSAGIIVLNTGKSYTNNNFEGYYVGLADNTNVNPTTNYDSVTRQYTVTGAGTTDPSVFYSVPESRLDYALSSLSATDTDSVGRTLENVSKYNIQGAAFDDTISLGLFKSRITPFNNTELNLSYFLAEGYTGSLNSFRKLQSETGGPLKSIYLEDVEVGSPNVEVIVNPYISKHSGDWTSNIADIPTKKVRTHRTTNFEDKIHQGFYEVELNQVTNINYSSTVPAGIFSFGAYQDVSNTNKNLGDIPAKLNRILEIASNVDVWPVDVTVEAGLGTIWVNERNNTNTAGASAFDDTDNLDLGNVTTGTGFYTGNMNMVGSAYIQIRDDYRSLFNAFEQFARETRKDHIFVADPIRNIFVQGANGKVLDDRNNNFSRHIYWPLRHQFDFANSNYATVYGTWAKVYDETSGNQIWVPFSGIAAAKFAQTDSTYAPWYAPAGHTRGVVNGVNDLAVKTTQRHRDLLYKIAVNPVAHFPNEGFIIYGQKTLQRRPSAFDRINVRRLFLNLEKRTKETMKQFLFEPNTVLTRSKVVNTLTPIFENAKQTEGVYDYLIVCDGNNNTASTIDNNELIVDIYLKPVRAAEFIRVNFYAVNTDVNFQELLS